MWSGKRVLVTGGAGFLGSSVSHALAAKGAEVIALDAMLPGTGANRHNLAGCDVRLVEGDLRSMDLAEVTDGIDAVFNMAAQISHAGSQADPLDDLSINATAQLRLILALRVRSPKAIVVHGSTRQFYGRPQALPVPESHPISPPDANGVSKFAGEQYWMLENKVHCRPVVSLRLTNCYGPRLRIMDHRQTFLGIWFRRVLEGQPFEVWGGAQTRDLAYADDVVAAFIAAAETEAAHGKVFNLGGSPPISLKALADTLIAANGGEGCYIEKEFPADRAAIDIGSYYADDSAFRRVTGWAPRVGLEEGLRRSLDWYRERLADYV